MTSKRTSQQLELFGYPGVRKVFITSAQLDRALRAGKEMADRGEKHKISGILLLSVSLLLVLSSCSGQNVVDSDLDAAFEGSVSYLMLYEVSVGGRVEPAYGHWFFEASSGRQAYPPALSDFIKRMPLTMTRKLSSMEFEKLTSYLEEEGFWGMPSSSVDECVRAVLDREAINAIILWTPAGPRAVIKQNIAGAGKWRTGRLIKGAERERLRKTVEQFQRMESFLIGLQAVIGEPETRVRIFPPDGSELLKCFRKHMNQMRIRVAFKDVGGLLKDHPVRLGASTVGVVDIVEKAGGEFLITLLLEKKIEFYEGYEFRILKDETTDSPYVWMYPGNPSRPVVDSSELLIGAH